MLNLRWRSGWFGGRRVGRDLEMLQDLLDDAGLVYDRDDLEPTTALVAFEHVDLEDPESVLYDCPVLPWLRSAGNTARYEVSLYSVDAA